LRCSECRVDLNPHLTSSGFGSNKAMLRNIALLSRLAVVVSNFPIPSRRNRDTAE
jgi:hypothetical protein